MYLPYFKYEYLTKKNNLSTLRKLILGKFIKIYIIKNFKSKTIFTYKKTKSMSFLLMKKVKSFSI